MINKSDIGAIDNITSFLNKEYLFTDLRKIASTITKAFILLDSNDRIKIFNDAACRKYDISYEDAIEKNINDLQIVDDFIRSSITVNIQETDNTVSKAVCVFLLEK